MPYVDKHVAKGGGIIFHKENFQEIFMGVENFSFLIFSEFWCFPSGFWCQNSYEGENLPKIPNGGWKITTRTTPQTGGDKILGIF